MKATRLTPGSLLVLALLLIQLSPAHAITFTGDTHIGVNDTTFDGMDVIVTNCTLTVDGPHSFASIQILSGGVITHTFAANGNLPAPIFSVAGEAHLLSSNGVSSLTFSNVNSSTIRVRDWSGSVIYTNGADYEIVAQANGMTGLQLLSGSSITEGSTNLVDYQCSGPSALSGLTLTISNSVLVEAGGSINVNGKGFGGGQGPRARPGNWQSPQWWRQWHRFVCGWGGRRRPNCDTSDQFLLGNDFSAGRRRIHARVCRNYLLRRCGISGQLVIDNGGSRGTNTVLSAVTSSTLDVTVSGAAVVTFSGIPNLHNLLITPNSWIEASNLFLTASGDVVVEAGGAFIADGNGYSASKGPGAGRYVIAELGGYVGGGAGYGGFGGAGAGATPALASGGTTYGNVAEPMDLGSGGGAPSLSVPGSAGGRSHPLNYVGDA